MSYDSLGDFLREEREKRGITLEQVASATKINVRVLHMLESDQYSDLPAKPFVRGFVMSYARFVGLDVQDILTRFSHFLEEKVKERPKKDSGHMGYAFEKKESEQSRTWLWTVLTAFAIVGGISIIFLKPKLKRHHSSPVDQLRSAHGDKNKNPLASPSVGVVGETPKLPQPHTTASAGMISATPTPVPSAAAPTASPKAQATPTPTPKVTPSPSPTPVASASGGPSPSPAPVDPLNKGDQLKPAEVRHKVVIKAADDIYVRYTVDGKVTMLIVLRKDSLLMLKALNSIAVQVSDPERTYVKYRTADFVSLTQLPNVTQRNEMTTIIRPVELIEKTQDPFPGAKKVYNPPPRTKRAESEPPKP